MAIRKNEYAAEQPLRGARIAGSLPTFKPPC